MAWSQETGWKQMRELNMKELNSALLQITGTHSYAQTSGEIKGVRKRGGGYWKGERRYRVS